MTAAKLTVIVPALNEALAITPMLQSLTPLRARGVQVIVVDGGSQDDTVALARPLTDHIVTSARGRAQQMNAGAAIANGATLLFLHADTRLPPDADELVLSAVRSGEVWGRFDVTIAGRAPMLRLVGALMNLRSRTTGIATGDQAIFVRANIFADVGGFPEQPLMEDIEISKRLKQVARPACLRARVVTSGRRWETHGVWRTIVLMWYLRWRYWRGESPAQLKRAYR